MSWLKIKKNNFVFSYCTQQQWTCPIRLWHVMKNGLYMTTTDDQLSGWTEKFQCTSQSKSCNQKRSWSLFGGLLPNWSTTFFWTLAKPLHLRSILSKSVRYTENYSACSQYWLTERAQFSKTIPDCTSHNQHFQRWTNWTMRFCLICHISSDL